MMQKICTKCNECKSLECFYKKKNSKDGLYTHCKSCMDIAHRTRMMANPMKQQQYQRGYRIEHAAKLKEKHRIYVADRASRDSMFKLKGNLRTLIGNSLRKGGFSKTSKTRELLGADFEVVKAHLEQTFLQNYGIPYDGRPVHIDHKVPCSFAKTEDELIALQHYTNLQYLAPIDNLAKEGRLDWSINANR